MNGGKYVSYYEVRKSLVQEQKKVGLLGLTLHSRSIERQGGVWAGEDQDGPGGKGSRIVRSAMA